MHHFGLSSKHNINKKVSPKEQISIYKKRVIPENNSLYKSCATRNRTGDTSLIIGTVSPFALPTELWQKQTQIILSVPNHRK